MTTTVTRFDFSQLQGITPKLIRFFEELFATASSSAAAVDGIVADTGSIQNATVLTLSSNAAFNNERVTSAGDGLTFTVTDNTLVISQTSPVRTTAPYVLTFNLAADTYLNLPALGRVPSSEDGPYADNAAAAAAGINVGEWYAKTDGSVVWRQV